MPSNPSHSPISHLHSCSFLFLCEHVTHSSSSSPCQLSHEVFLTHARRVVIFYKFLPQFFLSQSFPIFSWNHCKKYILHWHTFHSDIHHTHTHTYTHTPKQKLHETILTLIIYKTTLMLSLFSFIWGKSSDCNAFIFNCLITQSLRNTVIHISNRVFFVIYCVQIYSLPY